MAYCQPENVRKPEDCWAREKILKDQGESGDGALPDRYSIAMGYWRRARVLAIRLNGGGIKPAGHPVARGDAAWFVVPTELNDFVLSLVDRESGTEARAFLSVGSNVISWPSPSISTGEYASPCTVKPKSGRCSFDRLLLDQGPSPVSADEPARFALALGSWGDRRRLLIRWNGVPQSDRAKGWPLAGSTPNWFPLPIDCGFIF
jgi:hypothetical protein